MDRVPEGASWKYSTGFINEDMLRDHMPVPDEHTMIFMCAAYLLISPYISPTSTR